MIDACSDFETEWVIESSHPSLSGHFPGNPIVPGVVLLDTVAAALEQWCPGRRITAVPRAKFLLPLLPGVPFRIAFSAGKQGRTRFECTAEDRIIAEGIIEAVPGEAFPAAAVVDV